MVIVTRRRKICTVSPHVCELPFLWAKKKVEQGEMENGFTYSRPFLLPFSFHPLS